MTTKTGGLPRHRRIALAMRTQTTAARGARRCVVCGRPATADGETGIRVVGDRVVPAGLYHAACYEWKLAKALR